MVDRRAPWTFLLSAASLPDASVSFQPNVAAFWCRQLLPSASVFLLLRRWYRQLILTHRSLQHPFRKQRVLERALHIGRWLCIIPSANTQRFKFFPEPSRIYGTLAGAGIIAERFQLSTHWNIAVHRVKVMSLFRFYEWKVRPWLQNNCNYPSVASSYPAVRDIRHRCQPFIDLVPAVQWIYPKPI